MAKSPTPPIEIISHYKHYDEKQRLFTDVGKLELTRTQDILSRHLPSLSAIVLDVGGGPGTYSCWLAKKGYQVHLVDPVPSHVEQAKQFSSKQPENPIASFTTGDARKLDFTDEFADVVLFMGPLYHLTEKEDRMVALREAYRTLKWNGILFSVAISRFASTVDGLIRGFIYDPDFAIILKNDLDSGQHRNHTNNLDYFTTAYFHHPNELKEEVEEAGFQKVRILAIDGLGCLLQNFEHHWEDLNRRKILLDILRKTEEEPSLMGVSAHIMTVSSK